MGLTQNLIEEICTATSLSLPEELRAKLKWVRCVVLCCFQLCLLAILLAFLLCRKGGNECITMKKFGFSIIRRFMRMDNGSALPE